MAYPETERVKIAQAERIKAMEKEPGRYEERAPSKGDHEACKGYGYSKGALCKFRDKKTGAISIFCSLEELGEAEHPLPLESRPFPETYSDWVSLGMDIKEKAGIDDLETTRLVNMYLNHIYEEEQDSEVAQESKRWLMAKAGELRIK